MNKKDHQNIDTFIKRSAKSALSPILASILSPDEEGKGDDTLEDLDLGALFQWILCFAVVNFDLETGHILECTYPPIPFSDEERKTL